MQNQIQKTAPEMAERLIKNGYQPIPIPHGQKGPCIPKWQARAFSPDDFSEPSNIGLLCGHNQLSFLDIDIYCPDVVSAIVSEWQARFGKRGLGGSMRRTGEAPKTGTPFRTDAGATKTSQAVRPTGNAPVDLRGTPKIEQIEVLATGQQFVAYGIHPDTQQPYRWHGLDPADNFLGRAEDLPYVSTMEVAEFLAWVAQEFGPEEKTSPLAERASAAMAQPAQWDLDASEGPSRMEAKEILSYINPDCGYNDWLNVLMAVHSRFGGSQEGLTLADEWSAQGAKYKPGEVARKWASFKKHGVKWATAAALARQNGADLSAIARKYSNRATDVSRLLTSMAGPQDQASEIAPQQGGLPLRSSGTFCAARQPADYLVDGSLRCGWLYTLTAPTGHGKSAVTLALAYAVASLGWMGSNECKTGSVLFLAGENHDDIRERWIALCEHNGVDPEDLPVTFMEGVHDLKGSLPNLREYFRENPLTLVCVDTLAAYFDGDNENDNAQQQAFATDVLRPLTELPGRPTVVVPSHPTKGAGKDALTPKGGSSLLNAVDGNLSAWKSDDVLKIHWQGKFRGAQWKPWHVQLSEYRSDTLLDSKGRQMPTVIARAMLDSEIGKATEAAEKVENQVLKLILDGMTTREMAEEVFADGQRGYRRPASTV